MHFFDQFKKGEVVLNLGYPAEIYPNIIIGLLLILILFVSDVINDKTFSIKEAASALREAMFKSNEVQDFLEKNPGASIEKATAYSHGEQSKSSKDQSWLKRITKESAHNSQNNTSKGGQSL